MIKIIKAIILGIVQGITEVLPISSSAHNALIHYFIYDTSINLTNEIFLHFASLLALIIFMRKDIFNIIKKIFCQDFKYIISIIIGSIPALIVYLLFNKYIKSILTNITLIGFFLIITSLILIFIYSLFNNSNKKIISKTDSLFIGFCQSIALIPGISRSGMTLYGGLLKGINYKETIKFSLFLFLVASSGSLLLEYKEIASIDLNLFSIITFITTFFFTLVSLHLIVNKIKRKHFLYFSLYTLLLGIIVIIFTIR